MPASLENGRFLYHLDRNPAGKKHHACASGDRPAGKRANEFVERIVAADVLAQRDESFVRSPESGCVNGASCAIKHPLRESAATAAETHCGVT
jgi:hypothetical protein